MSFVLPSRARRFFRLALHRRDRLESEVDDEIQFHIAARTDQLVRQGMPPELARVEATRKFGSLGKARASLTYSALRRDRRVRFREKLEAAAQDVRISWRGLRRSPSFLAVAVLCLTLGIGANAAIFSVINGVLLRPLPFAHPEKLVRVWRRGAVPPGIYLLVKAQSRSYDALGGFQDARLVNVTGAGAPSRYSASDVTGNLFEVLGVRAEIGRTLLPGDNNPGRDRIVLLGDAMWRERFGGDPGIVGRTVTIDGVPRTIVGVLPRGFLFPSADVQLWTPALFAPSDPYYWWGRPLRLVGRLASGVSPSRARAEAATVFARARSAFPMRMADDWGSDVDVVSLRESMVGGARSTLLLLFAAVGLVLLIACVNVATLYIDRALEREREIAVRAALGAGRGRIAVQLLSESLLVAGLGAAGGLALAVAGVRILVAMLPPGTPRAAGITVDGRVLAFTLVLAILSGLAFGMLPALRAGRLDVQSSLRKDGRTGDSPRRTSQSRMLVVAQVALAVIIVSAAGLLLKSFWLLRQVDLGFDSSHVIAAEIPLPSFDRDTAARAPTFYDAVLERARSIPGVLIAATTSAVPFGATAFPAAMEVEAHPTPPGGEPAMPIRTTVSPDYFRALGIPLLRGRGFTNADREGVPAVAIVDAAAARRFWPTEDAIGQRIRYVWMHDWITIVGVVGTVKRDSLSGAVQPSLYRPMAQGFGEEMVIVAKTTAGARDGDVTSQLRRAVAAVDPTVPVSDVHALNGLVAASASRTRFS
ncbi:MAG TPA: ABC transporter permease, partial [Gemmatimonadaceae bacterium]